MKNKDSRGDAIPNRQVATMTTTRETPETLGTFVKSGWELGDQTSVAAKAGEKGAALQGAMAVSPGVWPRGRSTAKTTT